MKSFEATINRDDPPGSGDWGVFAIDTPWKDFDPISIGLWDYGISPALGWVGYVPVEWAREQVNSNSLSQLPREIRFNFEYLLDIPRFKRDPETGELSDYGVNISDSVGNCKWRLVVGSSDYYDQYMHAEFEGRKYVWQLDYGHEKTCAANCHVVGVWRD